jgi:hypothetical protein
MQATAPPTDQAEDPIPPETVSIDAVMLRRKAAKRTLPFDLAAGELHLVPSSSSSSPQAEDVPARKKRRLEEPLPTTIDEAARKTASPDLSVGLPPPPPAADDDDDDLNADTVTDTQPNAGATRATSRWTSDEDAKLTRAVANTSKKKHGKEYRTDWVVLAALVPGRTRSQCRHRWLDVLDPIIGRANGHQGKWTEDEDIKLKVAVQTHGSKNWVAISALVPGRARNQCYNRWKDVLDPSIDHTGKWTVVEDSTLKDAVQTHGDKNWGAITALLPGRTKNQCYYRWHYVLHPNIDRGSGCKGKWTAVEDSKLKDAVKTHGAKKWGLIAALVPGRTKKQCCNRWHDALNPSIGRANGRTGKWTEDEDMKLKDAAQTHGGKNWVAIAALVPGRTKQQCRDRWRILLTWTHEEFMA